MALLVRAIKDHGKVGFWDLYQAFRCLGSVLIVDADCKNRPCDAKGEDGGIFKPVTHRIDVGKANCDSRIEGLPTIPRVQMREVGVRVRRGPGGVADEFGGVEGAAEGVDVFP